MIFKEAKCPNCGGELRLPEDKTVVKCIYCGGDVMVRESIEKAAAGVNIENLNNLAKSAFDAGNFQEAFDYYTKILEVDSGHYEAWLGKGLSAGSLSTIENFKLNEMRNCINKALDYAPENLKADMKFDTALKISGIVSTYENLWLGHCIELGDSRSVRVNLLFKRIDMLDALEYALGLRTEAFPTEEEGFDILIGLEITLMCKFIIDDQLQLGLDEDKNLREKYNSYVEKMKVIAPSMNFDLQEVKKSASASGGCFIATATMGQVEHPVVIQLREFRDSWLLKRRWGKIFVRYYYKIGPSLATFISRSKFFRHLSYRLVIRPSVYCAHHLLKK